MWVVERAVSPVTGVFTYLVVDDATFRPHPEVRVFVLYLRGAGRAPGTIRAYVPRLCRFLNWCESRGLNFKAVTVINLAAYKAGLEQQLVSGAARRLTGKTVNSHLTAILELLRFGAAQGLIEPVVVERLAKRRYITHPGKGFNEGESGQYRHVVSPTIRAREIVLPPRPVTAAQRAAIQQHCRTARDRFLVTLLGETGARIGEVLGLRRQDLHLLPDSSSLGCAAAGAHVHFVPRTDNANQARVKSGRPRTVPVEGVVVEAYREHQRERDETGAAPFSDYVFVNLTGSASGQPLSYSNVFQLLRRTGRRAGIQNFHPHQLRHAAATGWIRAGVAPDVVQDLLGHASFESTAVYLHASDEDKRAAVERVAALREGVTP